jgi:hypothetical protein
MIKNLIWSLIIAGLSTSSVFAQEKESDPFADAIKGILFNAIQQQLQNGPPQRESKPEQKTETNFNRKQSKSDTAIQIIEARVDDSTARIKGKVTGVTLPAQVFISDKVIQSDRQGYFSYETYLPAGLSTLVFTIKSDNGNPVSQIVNLERAGTNSNPELKYARLNPSERQVEMNMSSVALIVGVSEYSAVAPAEFADRDAQVFYDYARLKLGIPQDRIQTLVNDSASVVGLLSGINKWLKRSVKQGESDVYIFFAGHGLASDDGDTAYLIPYDGAPDFLERTAISRDEVFREVSSVNPRSVTVFLDTCYSGDTRGETRLIAGRPLSIKLQEQSLPKGFTVLTAAGGDQIAKPLKEAQHGLFSYFLMKGMEGGADSNSDNQITARELHTYVRENVVQQSGGSQVPELQGDSERVLVRFR